MNLQNKFGNNNKLNNNTPNSKSIRGYTDDKWYNNTFKEELSMLNQNNIPKAPISNQPYYTPPNLPIPHIDRKIKKTRKIQPGIQKQVNKFNKN